MSVFSKLLTLSFVLLINNCNGALFSSSSSQSGAVSFSSSNSISLSQSTGSDNGITSSDSDNGSFDSSSDVLDSSLASLINAPSMSDSSDGTSSSGTDGSLSSSSSDNGSLDSASDIASFESLEISSNNANAHTNFAQLITMKDNIPYLILIIFAILTTVIAVPFIIYILIKNERKDTKNTINELDNVINNNTTTNNDDNNNDIAAPAPAPATDNAQAADAAVDVIIAEIDEKDGDIEIVTKDNDMISTENDGEIIVA